MKRVALMAAIAVGCGLASCAQSRSSLKEQVADQVATDMLIDILIKPMHVSTHSPAFKDFPLETRLALFVSSPYSDLDQSTVELARVTLQTLVADLTKDTQYLTAGVKQDAGDDRALNEKYEVMVNTAVINNAAALSTNIIRAERVFTSSIGKELNAAKNKLKAALLSVIAANPELLQPFADAKPPSEELKQSRTKLRSLLDEARRKSAAQGH